MWGVSHKDRTYISRTFRHISVPIGIITRDGNPTLNSRTWIILMRDGLCICIYMNVYEVSAFSFKTW